MSRDANDLRAEALLSPRIQARLQTLMRGLDPTAHVGIVGEADMIGLLFPDLFEAMLRDLGGGGLDSRLAYVVSNVLPRDEARAALNPDFAHLARLDGARLGCLRVVTVFQSVLHTDAQLVCCTHSLPLGARGAA